MQIQQSLGTQSTDEVIASSGISFHLWRLNQHFWLICLLFPIVWLVQTPLTSVRLFLALAALLFYATSYTWLMWPHPASSRARKRLLSHTRHTRLIYPSLILFMSLIVLTLALSLLYGLAFLWLFIGVSAIAGVTLPIRNAFVAIVIFTLLPLGISVGTTGSLTRVDWLQIVPLMLLVRGLGVDMIGVTRLSSAIRELHTARAELACLKVEEERLRVARDLHDLLGHTLSLIALKSKLAGRLLEKEPTCPTCATCATHAAQEIREVEHVAHQSLREVREAVAGYRQPTLNSALEASRQLLEAAGISCSLDYTALSLPPVTDTVLAWTVREGVTNVIRHSRAQHCIIRIFHEHNAVHAEVINDGNPRERAENIPARKGLGLSGLTERITALGGRIEAGPLQAPGKAGFRLWIELPIQTPASHP